MLLLLLLSLTLVAPPGVCLQYALYVLEALVHKYQFDTVYASGLERVGLCFYQVRVVLGLFFVKNELCMCSCYGLTAAVTVRVCYVACALSLSLFLSLSLSPSLNLSLSVARATTSWTVYCTSTCPSCTPICPLRTCHQTCTPLVRPCSL
jgi:hypothetical protein